MKTVHAPAPSSPRQRTVAFTLVELLVVIGIIAVLISILLPTLASARRSANNTKCLSQLREIGNSLHLYSIENKGYWPVVRHEANATFPPSQPSLRSDPPRNDYWYQFLLKYFSRKSYDNTPGKRLGDFMGTPLWGCPQVTKYDTEASTSSADFNSGYGMGPYASYKPDTYIGVNSAPPAPAIKGSHWAMISNSSGGLQGRYFKQTEWTKPAERGIIADSRSWFLETRAIAVPNGQPTPQVKGTMGYDGAASDQFDRFRHGKQSRKIVAFNMLFCDGHAATLQDIREGYKAIRMKFPG